MKSTLKYITILGIMMLGISSCQRELIEPNEESGKVTVLPDGSLRIPIKLNIPKPTVVETRSSNLPDEEKISSLFLLVWEADNGTDVPTGNAKLLQKVQGTVASDGITYVVLKPYASPCNLRFVVNPTSSVLNTINAYIEGTTTFDKFKDITFGLDGYYDLTSSKKPGEHPDPPYPLSSDRIYLEALNQQTIDAELTDPIDLNICAARMDITNTVSDFTFTNATMLNGAQQGYVRRHSDIPMNFGGTVQYAAVAASSNKVSPIYLFANNGDIETGTGNIQPINPSGQGSNPTYVVVKGAKTGYPEGYYKFVIRYNLGTEAAPNYSYDINRNTLYAVSITEVNGPGYTTIEEAIANKPQNIITNIVADDIASHDLVVNNGEYFMGFTNSEYIAYLDGAITQNNLTATTLTCNAPATVTNATVTISGTGYSLVNQDGAVSVSGSVGTFVGLDGTAKQYNININIAAGAAAIGNLAFRIGNLAYNVVISKADYFIGDAASFTLSDNTNLYVAESDKDWITFTGIGTGGVNIQLARNRTGYRRGTAYLTGGQKRGRVKVEIDQYRYEVVYFERYGNGTTVPYTWGFYLADNPIDDPSATNPINDASEPSLAGYGVLIQRSTSADISVGTNITIAGLTGTTTGYNFSGTTNTNLYLLDQSGTTGKRLGAVSAYTVRYITYDNKATTNQPIFPNFAKGCYVDEIMGTSFSIRTPQQMINISTGVASTSGKTYNQEIFLIFGGGRASIGGANSFSSSIVNGNFQGTYNGNGVANNTLNGGNGSIQNLTINVTTATDNIGLFSQATGNATINEIILSGGSISSKGNYVGGIVGILGNVNNLSLRGATINNCSNAVTITGGNNSGGVGAVGGIVGYANLSTIYKCTNSGAVQPNIDNDVGGIVGRALSTNINWCDNTGSVNGAGSGVGSLSGSQRVGGIVGYLTASATPPTSPGGNYSISNCSNTGSVSAWQSPGGIAGRFFGSSIINCYNQGQVTGNNFPAGISGYVLGGYNCYIYNCYNTGYIKNNNAGSGSGAIIGEAPTDAGTKIEIQYCYALLSGGGEPFASSSGQNLSQTNPYRILTNVGIVNSSYSFPINTMSIPLQGGNTTPNPLVVTSFPYFNNGLRYAMNAQATGKSGWRQWKTGNPPVFADQ